MAAPEWDLLVGGVSLRGWTVTSGTFYRAPVSVRANLVEIPGRHGALSVGLPMFDEPSVTIEMTPAPVSVRAGQGDVAGLEGMGDDLSALLAGVALTARRTVAGVSREAPARLVSLTPGEEFGWGRFARFTAVLALPGVFFRDVAYQTVAVPAGASSHTVLAGSGPIVDAVVRWPWAPQAASPRSLVDVSSGTGVSVAPVNTNGTYVYVDAGNLAARRSNSASDWDVTHVTGSREDHNVDYPGPGPLQLWPAARQSEDGMVREVRVQASHACVVRYRRAWL